MNAKLVCSQCGGAFTPADPRDRRYAKHADCLRQYDRDLKRRSRITPDSLIR